MKFKWDTMEIEGVTTTPGLQLKYFLERMGGSILIGVLTYLFTSDLNFKIDSSLTMSILISIFLFISCYLVGPKIPLTGKYCRIKVQIEDSDFDTEVMSIDEDDLSNKYSISTQFYPRLAVFRQDNGKLCVENYIKISDYEYVNKLGSLQEEFEKVTEYEYEYRKKFLNSRKNKEISNESSQLKLEDRK